MGGVGGPGLDSTSPACSNRRFQARESSALHGRGLMYDSGLPEARWTTRKLATATWLGGMQVMTASVDSEGTLRLTPSGASNTGRGQAAREGGRVSLSAYPGGASEERMPTKHAKRRSSSLGFILANVGRGVASGA